MEKGKIPQQGRRENVKNCAPQQCIKIEWKVTNNEHREYILVLWLGNGITRINSTHKEWNKRIRKSFGNKKLSQEFSVWVCVNLSTWFIVHCIKNMPFTFAALFSSPVLFVTFFFLFPSHCPTTNQVQVAFGCAVSKNAFVMCACG